jgi:prolyl 4-hydroxylase
VSGASVLQEAHRLARSGRGAEAAALVERSAVAGDAEALFALANWRLYGLHGPRDLAAAHRHLSAAAAQGHVEAIRLRAILTGNGTGCAADPDRAVGMLQAIAPADPYSAAQLALLATMERRTGATQMLSQEPYVALVRGLFTREECDYLARLAEPSLQPSYVIDPATGGRMPHPVRTSTGTNFGPPREDLVVHALNRRLAAATGTEVGWGEPLHILRYAPGQEYRPHLDALPGVANQRIWSALVYLNEGYEGGETAFPDLDIRVRGKPGDVLVFGNVTPDGRPDLRTRHAGIPVTHGVKWLATRWIRQGPFDPFSASG